MGVPGSDERDYKFAKKYNLLIIEVVSKDGKINGIDQCYTEYGYAVNSDIYNGKPSKIVKEKINEKLKEIRSGGEAIQFKLHDWLISRQRYWGTPIPIVYCDECGIIPLDDTDLPLILPQNIKLSSTYGAELSPLATSESFINTKCPKCHKSAIRDADTMDTFVCSSWYYLRYPNVNYKEGPFDPEGLKLLPVDSYIGGAEHATMHLLYARFITKALRDGGYLNFDEPFLKLYHQGTITKDSAKMSKSRGNTVSPDTFIEKYGSDTFRLYLMFMGPYDEGGDWNDKGITGIDRFIKKIWKFSNLPNNSLDPNKDELQILHKTIHLVTKDVSALKFNTAISRLMEFINYFNNYNSVNRELKLNFIKLIAPFTPHLGEELWEINGGSSSIFNENYPKYVKELAVSDTVILLFR